MDYMVASNLDLDEIIRLKNEVKERVKEENLPIWLGDYPGDDLIKEDITSGFGRILKDGNEIVCYAALHKASSEYEINTFIHNDLYSFSRIMTKTSHLGRGLATLLIKQMLEEVKNKTSGFGLIVDDCNKLALNVYLKVGFKFEGYSRQIYGDFSNLTYYYTPSYTDNINYDLAKFSSLKHQLFCKKLYNTSLKILGCKIPDLRKYTKRIDAESFFNKIAFNTVETLMLGSILLKNYEGKALFNRVNQILDKTDTWVVTDLIGSTVKNIGKDPLIYYGDILALIKSNNTFKVRCALIILLFQYKNIKLYDKIFELIEEVKVDSYYVNMAIAWLLNTMSNKDKRVYDFVLKLNPKINKLFRQKQRDSLRERKK